MSEEKGVKAPVEVRSSEGSAAAARAGEVSWRRYPHLDAALESKTPAILANMEKTRTGIDRLSRTGTEREKERARAALAAYGRALELYQHLAGLRDDAPRRVGAAAENSLKK